MHISQNRQFLKLYTDFIAVSKYFVFLTIVLIKFILRQLMQLIRHYVLQSKYQFDVETSHNHYHNLMLTKEDFDLI